VALEPTGLLGLVTVDFMTLFAGYLMKKMRRIFK
jgi:hypothetical protein